MGHYKTYTLQAKTYNQGVGEGNKIEKISYDFPCEPATTGPSPGCLTGTCEIYNVMGQEDLFREDPVGVRVQNYTDGRIVFTTGVPTIAEIDYSANTTALDINTGILNPGSPTQFHEYFLSGLQVDSLYAFRVTAYATNVNPGDDWETLCPDPIVSGIYYFTIGGIVSIPDFSITFDCFDEIFTPDKTIFEELDPFITTATSQFPTLFGEVEISLITTQVFTTIAFSEEVIDTAEFYTTNQLTVI